MRSIPEFLLVALLVTITPGPGTAAILRVAARDGRAAAMSTVLGNSIGVLMWAILSAVGVSSLILASETAYNVLRIGGAAFLIVLGLRSLLQRARAQGSTDPLVEQPTRGGGWRIGIITSLSNPKLAVFFIALFPQFLQPHSAVLPAALMMAVVIVAFDLAWFGTLIYLVDRLRALMRPQVQQIMERVIGGVLIGVGVLLLTEA